MAHRIITLCLFSLLAGSAFATRHTVLSPDFTFSPATLNVAVGDTVIFSLESFHNAREVSQATWESNGSQALAGGWGSTPFGGGQVVIASAGTHYYVCSPHANGGMKGMISATVQTGISGVRKQDNPFTAKVINQKLTVNFSGTSVGTVGVFDLLGNKLYSSPANDDLEISLASFKTGVYFVVLNDQKGRFTQRVLYRKED